jgi:hypothetical protein
MPDTAAMRDEAARLPLESVICIATNLFYRYILFNFRCVSSVALDNKAVEGTVRQRPADMVNAKMQTGEIEVVIQKLYLRSEFLLIMTTFAYPRRLE